MSGKITAPKLLAMRQAEQKIVCLTAYDSSFGEFADAAGADVILVAGDNAVRTLNPRA